jgi:hypothetical protein
MQNIRYGRIFCTIPLDLINFVVEAGLSCTGNGRTFRNAALVQSISKQPPVQNEVDVLRKAVDQAIDLGKARSPLKTI